MSELNLIMAEVRLALAAKENEINKVGDCVIGFVKDAFKKRRMEVSSFERSNGKKQNGNHCGYL
ncbi:hypothetical protein [Mucilaginibacter sp.]|uniref:hypothetical protein n=1 Tax=Mucilaginibacter sp. TaxID=1882438 RepID=UPI003567F62E